MRYFRVSSAAAAAATKSDERHIFFHRSNVTRFDIFVDYLRYGVVIYVLYDPRFIRRVAAHSSRISRKTFLLSCFTETI